jgi:Potential Queuosine, Q, salvage protein family
MIPLAFFSPSLHNPCTHEPAVAPLCPSARTDRNRNRNRIHRNPPTVFFWKRAQIMIAETWAAFSPSSSTDPHPLFPCGISQLTMFADYRVPQILHHLRLLAYTPSLVRALEGHSEFASGAREEVAIRAASIVAVERVAAALRSDGRAGAVSSVLIDFFLWDLAKRLEVGEDRIEGIKTQPMLPTHRTRCIWY